MPTVIVSSSLCDAFTGGLDTLEVEARTIGQMIRELNRRFPGLGTQIEDRMAVAVDGIIYQDALAQPLGANSEIFLIPRISGGGR